MFTIENDFIRVIVNPAGAELNSLFNKTNGQEYLWDGDAKFWPKQSPLLFPIVGSLKNNRYFLGDKSYEIVTRHGFAREKIFSVTAQTPSSITFEISEDENTLLVFPFQFSLSVIYVIDESRLSVSYLVKNKGKETMYFSVGAHPAFRLPISDELAYDDYYLLFNKTETADRWPVSATGLMETVPVPMLNNTNQLPLSKSLFYGDAIVFKNLLSDEVQLKSDKHAAGLTFTFSGFPYMGIWAAKDANFVCIEPWCGISDSEDTNQSFIEKEGIIDLPSGEDFERTWSVELW